MRVTVCVHARLSLCVCVCVCVCVCARARAWAHCAGFVRCRWNACPTVQCMQSGNALSLLWTRVHTVTHTQSHTYIDTHAGGFVWCDSGQHPRKIFSQLPGGKPTTFCACFKEVGWSDVRQVCACICTYPYAYACTYVYVHALVYYVCQSMYVCGLVGRAAGVCLYTVYGIHALV